MGHAASVWTRRRSPRSRATSRTSTRSSATPSSDRCRPDGRLRRGHRRGRYHAETNPGGVRCTLADYMINVFGPRPPSDWGRGAGGRPRLRRAPARQRRRPVRPRGAETGAITPAQFVDLNAQDRRRDIDINPAPSGFARPARAANAYRSGGINIDQQPRRGRDHRPARPRPGSVPRRLSLVGDPRPARARARHLRQPRHLVRRRPADRRPQLRDRGPARDGPLAGGGREG